MTVQRKKSIKPRIIRHKTPKLTFSLIQRPEWRETGGGIRLFTIDPDGHFGLSENLDLGFAASILVSSEHMDAVGGMAIPFPKITVDYGEFGRHTYAAVKPKSAIAKRI